MKDGSWAASNLPPDVQDTLLSAASYFAPIQEHLRALEGATSVTREVAIASCGGQAVLDGISRLPFDGALGALVEIQSQWQEFTGEAEAALDAFHTLNPMQGLADAVSLRQDIDGGFGEIAATVLGLPELETAGAMISLAAPMKQAIPFADLPDCPGLDETAFERLGEGTMLKYSDEIRDTLTGFSIIDPPTLMPTYEPIPVLPRDFEQLLATRSTAEALQHQNEMLRETFAEERAARMLAEENAATEHQLTRDALEEARLQRIIAQRAFVASLLATAIALGGLLIAIF